MHTHQKLSDFDKELNDCYEKFLDYYTQQRDIQALSTLFSSDISNIGSGSDEFAFDQDEVICIFSRDIHQCPAPLDYEEKQRKIICLGPTQGLIIAHFNMQATIDNMPVTFKDQRISMLWEKTGLHWYIRHIHYSQCEPRLKQGESFPLSEIEEKNKTLEKLVNKRTRELCKLNIELSEANKEINEVKQRFETIFEKASDGIIVADWEKESFFMINQRICDILDYSKDELSGLWLKDLIPKESYEQSLQKILQETNGDRLMAEDIPLKCKNNKLRYFDVLSQVIKIKRKNYIVSLYRDITEHKKHLKLEQEAEVAQKASEAKNLFLANMSHEIRTPVTGIVGMSKILSQTPLDSKQSEYLGIVMDSAQVLLGLINDMLDISKIEAGQIQIKHEPFHLRELVKSLQTLAHPEVINKNNEIEIDIDPDIPQTIVTDKIRLEQVLMNLVNNAVKFTQNGKITIKARPHNPYIPEKIRFEITDTGIGIEKEHQPKLFQKFQQLDNSLSRPADGSGLGLFICKQLVALLGGEIGLESTPGKGSNFWFTFINQINIPANQTEEYEFEDEWDVSLGLNVLLVDDKNVNLRVISLMLETANCKTDTAFNGEEALQAFAPEKHDVILMDIMMPLMDGVTAMKELRKKHQTVPPIIAITANAMSGDKEKYMKEGFDGYITKPLTMKKLTSELMDVGAIEKA